jgi:hypothetical protein
MPDAVNREIAVAAEATEYRVVGPLPNNSFLSHVVVQVSNSAANEVNFSLALGRHRNLVAATMARAERLIDQGDTQVDTHPSWRILTGAENSQASVIVNRHIHDGPRFLYVRCTAVNALVNARFLISAIFMTREELDVVFGPVRPVQIVGQPIPPTGPPLVTAPPGPVT